MSTLVKHAIDAKYDLVINVDGIELSIYQPNAGPALVVVSVNQLITLKDKLTYLSGHAYVTRMDSYDNLSVFIDVDNLDINQTGDKISISYEQLDELIILGTPIVATQSEYSDKQIVVIFMKALTGWQGPNSPSFATCLQKAAYDNNWTFEQTEIYYERFSSLVDWVSENLPA